MSLPRDTTPGMNSKQFQRYLDRDLSCPHCGSELDLIPQHRQNRGMGGSKARDVPSNIMVMCSELNGLIESNATLANLAKDYGWKLTAGQDPKTTPMFHSGAWWLLDDKFGRVEVNGLVDPEW
jgi:hypothetical protein